MQPSLALTPPLAHTLDLSDEGCMQDLPAVRAPEFPSGLEWVNASAPITLAHFRGRFVAIEFWTSC